MDSTQSVFQANCFPFSFQNCSFQNCFEKRTLFYSAFIITWAFLSVSNSTVNAGEKTTHDRPKRILLIGQKPDSHPWLTHEYNAGMRILAQCLHPLKELQIILTSADEPWKEGPELIQSADGIVLFVSEGGKWIQKSSHRLLAFQNHVKQGKALAVLHWGMGCKDKRYIENFKNLFGGCHGGPDRKYKFLTTTIQPIQKNHPVTEGIGPLKINDEFYYALKFVKNQGKIIPLISARIDDADQTVAWGWERPDGGRSFGFSGLHHHINWKEPEYRKLITQGVLWTLNLSGRQKKLSLEISEKDLLMPRPKQDQKKP